VSIGIHSAEKTGHILNTCHTWHNLHSDATLGRGRYSTCPQSLQILCVSDEQKKNHTGKNTDEKLLIQSKIFGIQDFSVSHLAAISESKKSLHPSW
jgi:hypothetical protein